MSKEFSGKVVLITGASAGIGAGTAIYFSSLGASLALTGRNLENLGKVADQCTTSKPLLIQADITKSEDQQKIIDTTIKQYGRLDVLVNNAGIYIYGNLQESNLQILDKIMDTNVRAIFQLTKLAIPHLLKTKGNIVNVSSLAGLRAYCANIAYCMSKKALDQFTECLALELAPQQVRVNSVNPGVILTDIFFKIDNVAREEGAAYIERAKGLHPLGRIGKVEDVAYAIAYLASEKASFITGVLLPIDGGRQLTSLQ